MANYATLKSAIEQVIKTNGNNEITGALLQQSLLAMINTLGAGYQFVGIATPATNPGTPDYNVFYVASTAGTYSNFPDSNNVPLVVNDGEIAILKYNGTWTKDVTGAATAEKVTQLDQKVDAHEQKIDLFIDEEQVTSPNLFDKSTVTPNRSINAGKGTVSLTETAGYSCSDFIPIPAGASSLYGTNLYGYGTWGWACYDSNKAFTHGLNAGGLVTLQSGDAYFRFTLATSDLDVAMVVAGTSADVPSEYMPYGEISQYVIKDDIIDTNNIKDGAVTNDKIADGAVTNDKIADGAVTPAKTTFISVTTHTPLNLLDPNACVLGYVNKNNGNIDTSITTRYASGFIPVDSDGLYTNSYSGYGVTGGWAVYDANKNFIRGEVSDFNTNYSYVSGDAYVRITLTTGGIGTGTYVVKASDPHKYTDYFPPYNVATFNGVEYPASKPSQSLTGLPGLVADDDTISNETQELSDYPQYVKRSFNLTAGGKITAFNQIDLGVGEGTFNGTGLRVDNTNVYLIRENNGTINVIYTQAHGLTIQSYITISAYMKNGVLTARISTFDSSFSYTFPAIAADCYGKPFCRADSSTTLTGFVFRAAGVDFREPIWVLGDSYVSWYPERWVYQLGQMNIRNFLLDGLAGAGSATMFSELEKLLEYGTPKFLIWCLGMNDTYDEWSVIYAELVQLCEENGITLILQTIPWPTGGDKADINNVVLSSGYRYIDVYAAVSSDAVGTWYAGYNADGIHTSVDGAIAQANRFILDFPEIFQ